MKKRSSPQEEDTEVNMTPMLDIVFIMLIFFIVTAVFVKEPGVKVEKPEATNAISIKRLSTLIGVSENNKIWINKQEVELNQLKTVAADLHMENPKGKMVITADKKSNAHLVIQIIDQLNQIGIVNVAVSTSQGE